MKKLKSYRAKNTFAGQTIATKYIPCGNVRGSRVKAKCERGEITLSWDDSKGVEENHQAAVDALIARFVVEDEKRGTPKDKNPWARPYVMGGLPGSGFVAVYIRKYR